MKHCTNGDVQSHLQAGEIAIWVVIDDFFGGSGFKVAGLGASPNCQFRLYAPEKLQNGEPWTFCEDEPFMGGIVWFFPYVDVGVSRQTAVAELDLLGSLVEFGPLEGTQTEQALVRTANKDYIDPVFGQTVYTQEAFVTQVGPGSYLSKWTPFFAGFPFDYVEVVVEVVSHEEHVQRVEDGTWRIW